MDIAVYQAVNATVDMPVFEVGTTNPVKCTATKIDQTQPAIVQLQVCSPAGCCAIVDPVLTTVRIPKGKERVKDSFADIPSAEHFVTIQNGHPGLRKFHVFVNGQRAAYLRIGPRETQTIDIASAMTRHQNTITLTGQGRPGASALVIIADVPWRGNKSLVEWETSAEDAGVNMHWGRGGADVM